MKNWWHIIQNILNLLGKKVLFHQVDFEEESVGDHMESSNSVKDIGTIGCCSKRRMSAVKFGAIWGWGSSWIMNLLGLSSNCFWQNFMLVTLWVFLSKVNKCHQSEKNTWRAFFTVKFLLKGMTRVGVLFLVVLAGKTAEEGWLCLSLELPSSPKWPRVFQQITI